MAPAGQGNLKLVREILPFSEYTGKSLGSVKFQDIFFRYWNNMTPHAAVDAIKKSKTN